MHPIKNVFRCIVRHVYFLNDAASKSNLDVSKRKVRTVPKSQIKQRRRIADSFMFEKALRDICLGRSTMARLDSLSGETDVRERNQDGSYGSYMQHDMRRFDEYNKAPSPGSETAKRVEERATYANSFWKFARLYNKVPGVSPNIKEVANPQVRRWSVIMGTISAPFREMQIANGWKKKRVGDEDPLDGKIRRRTVSVKSVERNSLSLPVLLVKGKTLPGNGFSKRIAEVNKDYQASQQKLQDQIWLATQYSQDPSDGEDMSEWIDQLRAAQAAIRQKVYQLEQKLEVQRRVLSRRRDEIQQNFDYEYRRKVQNYERQQKLTPPKLLTLKDL